jgi:serine/threonine protein kinase/Leucine-rich repeat (LRR) protein
VAVAEPSDDPRVSELLARWYQLRRQGQSVTADELCQDCPELVPDVRQLLHDLPPRPPPDHTPVLLPEVLGPYAAARDASPPAAHEDQPTEWQFLAAPSQPDEIGRLGPYRVLKVLGKGGMGVVFLAQDPQLRRSVALKAMLPEFAGEPTARRRFLREARAAAGLKHDHIVAIYHVGEERGAPFFVMELLEGESLQQRLQRGPLPLAASLRIGREVAEGLAAAHVGGVIHRDIKPANIWLDGQRGRAIILDFGLARTTLVKETRLSQLGQILGTPAYMAPEQITDATVDFRCDLYSLGVILYELATGRPPFTARDVTDLLMAVVEQAPAEPRTLNPSAPVALNALILRLLAKKPADRPASAQAVVAELSALEAAQRLATPAPAVPATPLPPRRSLPLAAGGLAALGALVLVPLTCLLGAALWRLATNQEQEVQQTSVAGTTAPLVPVAVPSTPKQKQETPREPVVKTAAADDRQVAIWVLSTGGSVGITKRSGLIVVLNDLPEGTWEVNNITVGNKKKVGDADLQRLKVLTKLQSLSLANAQVSDAGLEQLKTHPALGSLNLRMTQVGNAGMKHVAALPKLMYLLLMNTKVGDAGLEYLKPVLPGLLTLELAGTPVSDAGLVHLEPATRLKYLNLSCKLVSDAGLKHLKTLTSLETLALSGSAVTGAGLEHLKALPELKRLELRSTGVDDTALERLALLKLTYLVLGQTKITNEGLKHLRTLGQLQHLMLDHTAVDDAGLEHLAGLSNLQALYLQRTGVSDAGLEHLKTLTNLTILDLSYTRVTAAGAEALRQALPKCKVTLAPAK